MITVHGFFEDIARDYNAIYIGSSTRPSATTKKDWKVWPLLTLNYRQEDGDPRPAFCTAIDVVEVRLAPTLSKSLVLTPSYRRPLT